MGIKAKVSRDSAYLPIYETIHMVPLRDEVTGKKIKGKYRRHMRFDPKIGNYVPVSLVVTALIDKGTLRKVANEGPEAIINLLNKERFKRGLPELTSEERENYLNAKNTATSKG